MAGGKASSASYPKNQEFNASFDNVTFDNVSFYNVTFVMSCFFSFFLSFAPSKIGDLQAYIVSSCKFKVGFLNPSYTYGCHKKG